MKAMNNEEFNRHLRQHFNEANKLGLGELLLFGKTVIRFVEGDGRRQKLINAVLDIGGYNTNARDFAKMISYEDFKKRKGISEIMALGLKLYLLYHCGVDWLKPNTKVTGIDE